MGGLCRGFCGSRVWGFRVQVFKGFRAQEF